MKESRVTDNTALHSILDNPPTFKASTETGDDFATVRHLLVPAAAPINGMLWLPERTPISSQGSGGSCAPTGVCDGFEQIMETPVQLSRNFLYWNARRANREEALDAGTDLYTCFKSVKLQGVCEESLWPYDVSKILERPPLSTYERAYDNRVAAFYNIKAYTPDLLPSIDNALEGGMTVVFGLKINVAAFYAYKGGEGVIEAPSNTDSGHVMVIVGYKLLPNGRKVYIFRNSWTVSWGNGGYGLISPEYLAAGLYSAEFYVPVAMPLIAVSP